MDIKNLIGVYSDPERDPRGHTISISFLAKSAGGIVMPATDASDAAYFNLYAVNSIELAFDHEKILNDALNLMNNL